MLDERRLAQSVCLRSRHRQHECNDHQIEFDRPEICLKETNFVVHRVNFTTAAVRTKLLY